MTIGLPHQHLSDGLRRVEVALPPALVAELDSAIAQRHINVSRSRVIAIAIRRLLDQGGMVLFPTYPDWP